MNNLLKLRTEKGLSQVNIATKIGVAQETVSGYEIGRAYPTVENLIKLCDLFQVSADFLLDRTSIRTPADRLMAETLSSNELELLEAYRRLNNAKKERAIGMVTALEE